MSNACWQRISKCSFLSVVRRNCYFRGWKKSHRQNAMRKRVFAWLIHFVAFDSCWWIWESDCILSGSHTGESVLALQEKMWKRERVFYDEVFIENTCHEIGSKNAGQNSNKDVVLNMDHVVLLANVFPRLIISCVRHLCFGNKWHTADFKLLYECKSYKFLTHVTFFPVRELFWCNHWSSICSSFQWLHQATF